MTRFAKSSLLLSVAVLALSACGGSKGPGALGSKDDIVVRNNGLPGATAPVPPSAEGEIEQAQAAPTPEVAQAPLEMPGENQPVPANDPAVEEAAQKVQEAQSPVSSTASTPMSDGTPASTAPVTETVPADIVAPEPVAEAAQVEPAVPAPVSTTPDSVPAGTSIATTDNTYVPNDAPASAVSALNAKKMGEAAAPASTPVASAPMASPSSVYPAEDYPADARAQAEATATAAASPSVPPQGTGVISPVPASAPAINFADPEIVKSVQAALKLKGAYKGKEDGVVNTQYLNALSKYQGDNKLPQGGVNLETLRHLGVVQ